MNELTYDRIKDNLETLGMKNTLTIIDNYLEKAIHDKTNIVEVLDYLLSQEAKSKRSRASENQIRWPAFHSKRVWTLSILNSSPV
jgi:hypothetical protein